MKQIEPVQMWYNGQTVEADALNSYVTNDNLSTQANFWYGIGTAIDMYPMVGLTPIVSGNLVMTGADYLAYETNQYAYDWIAKQLNLTIVGNYPEPTTTTTTTVAPTTTTTSSTLAPETTTTTTTTIDPTTSTTTTIV